MEQPIQEGARPDVTILVPALNEEDTIREVVERLLALPISKQVVVIDDGSTDQTPQILKEYVGKIDVLTHSIRSGKGMAIRSGLVIATGKVVIIQDADLEYFPEEIPMLVDPILRGEADVVYGTRFRNGLPKDMPLPNKLANLLLRWSVGVLFWRRISDEATCYKAFRTELLRRMNLECSRFEFCPEVTAKSIRLRKRIVEIPIQYVPRTKDAGKKIRWTDAVEAFWTLFKHRFKPF
ncbi:MAG: Dodecaprenyl-phosphate galacturonate synthase [Fimbriimonadaceae bacterium]|nr:Dodecaprenyl-phosphate galacturonate synthase [Fimbriimonadaceae bacterium]